MSIPKNHHFLPKFLVKGWCDEEGRTNVFRRVGQHGILTSKRLRPSELGYKRHLYSNYDADSPLAQQRVETKIMSPIDNAAAKALHKILFDVPENEMIALEGVARNDWARFLASMVYRSPSRIAFLKERVRLEGRRATETEARKTFKQLRPRLGDTKFEEWFSWHSEQPEANRALLLEFLCRDSRLAPVFSPLNMINSALNRLPHDAAVTPRRGTRSIVSDFIVIDFFL